MLTDTASSHDLEALQPFFGEKSLLDTVAPNAFLDSFLEKSRSCIHQLFEARVALTPEAIALQLGSQTLTYCQLNNQANQLAHYLIKQGTTVDSLVAVSTPRSLEMAIAILGVLKAGAAYVPIDPAYPPARRRYLLKDALKNAPTPLLLTTSALFETLSADIESDEAASPKILQLDTDWATIAQQPQNNLEVEVTEENLAYVIYTSGSTGNPKGVMVRHQGVVNHAIAMATAFEMTPSDRMLQFSSMSFDIIVEELYPTLITGATLVLRPEEIATSLSAFLKFTAAEKITILDLPTAFWHELVGGLVRMSGKALAESIRLVIVGGEKASRAIYAQWFELVGEYPRWLNTYGPTETTVTATLYDPIAAGFDGTKELPIGQAIVGVTTWVLNHNSQPVSPGTPGELYIGGPGLARGYLNLPEKTAAAFVDHPFEEGARLYKTGDIVQTLPDGNLEFVGRADFQVKIRGFRIELGEIERRLEEHPNVQQPVVLAREDVPGQKQLVAYVVASNESTLQASELQAFVGETLPSYMIPSAIVPLGALPMTTNGKVDRKALPAPKTMLTGDIASPTTPLESQLVEIWQTVLGSQPLGITHNFFELGGNSLLVMRLLGEIETCFNQSLPVTSLFDAPTIQQFAPVLQAQLSAQNNNSELSNSKLSNSKLPNSLVLLKAGTQSPPLFLVHDADGITSPYVNLAAQLPEARPVYGIQPLSAPGIPMVHTRIPEMAAHYIEQIQQVQPQGPYLLGGLCAGGVIAFEMALQLEAAGESVALVALLEAPDVAAKVNNSMTQQRLQNMRNTLPSNKLKLAQVLLGKVINTVRYETQNRFNQAKAMAKINALRYWQNHQVQDGSRGWMLPQKLRGVDVRSLYLFAEKSYEPSSSKLKGKAVLIKAAGPGEDEADQIYSEVYEDALFGWGDRTQQPIEHYQVPGGHSTMLNADNVMNVINVLKEPIAKGLEQTVSTEQ
ncbi:MAG: amino acid adenylation domain-containing protein [Cyanobacteria bacterium J06634_5]